MSHRGTIELMLVQPDVAAKWRAKSRQKYVSNRKLEPLLAALRNDEWDPDLHRHEPAKVYKGRLVNGNHRCTAIAKTGIAALMWVHLIPETDVEAVHVADG